MEMACSNHSRVMHLQSGNVHSSSSNLFVYLGPSRDRQPLL